MDARISPRDPNTSLYSVSFIRKMKNLKKYEPTKQTKNEKLQTRSPHLQLRVFLYSFHSNLNSIFVITVQKKFIKINIELLCPGGGKGAITFNQLSVESFCKKGLLLLMRLIMTYILL